ncbi:ArsR/SmtB family transcription factor [Hyphobacterium sp.]|jgi:DNA-binding transcriptional ArsR family regulator|uniref:ArsR/SmtB family transcription factor n=1 Tax=Hyphobacterium sp. TaxID=2004662 RepID=UPI003BAC7BF3
MDKINALGALGALAQESRLDVFRLLVKAGDNGLPAGEIAAHLNVRQNTMSTHLGILTRAGLIRRRREGRVIRYAADFNGMRGLIGFLMRDCCGGVPEIVRPLAEDFSNA